MSDIDAFDSVNQVSAQTITLQPIQDQLEKFLQDHLQDTGNSAFLDDNYDYELFLESLDDSTTMFHITCKLLPNSLILNILNKEIYGFDFDVTELRRRNSLTLHQKLNLERNLKQTIPLYFLTSNH
ncbi:uncharacterized protein OCT59_025972 [Rhizophagus irregularis]|uniref:Uncharacterized protein n=1 Tax=Rhizophagus irregularis (strain DAOM 181602 / DAOM 197198 / MUCL 43194) TaxID=747089 RepID=A0A2P4Q5K6_RHIID|nr:hypothetical protein GLOIN_2v1773040 [Rhizophagus irregularis DAOM 181602=DAOM 197198]POG72930.1 hypothetical protein GLOIN_2v1773040 [Rhizophagus irregularis DAOM 181602=DAOM 197198]UZO05628.1 hypothetical protein OCT59_025972 [Rhizophagus irregularis]GET51907.1 hypothetical protein GLOIN_2v1773040 [Rhizophagus irregularis DAOM 181602=DAOM 197198]CAG8694156.1 4283_t:CDS:2 [Rhizophagus irregularis]|eukprot:XP_025179796.1 hypothetical protein GLOIN_2v1773040 [Rhizophagus irregularis DAOM 181602=DAOM 197198]